MNVIADVGGQYDALRELKEMMPEEETVLLGDLNDRGPKSRQVIEFAMTAKNVRALNSNHGHIFVDFILSMTDPDYCRSYVYETFLQQGGLETLASYGATPDMPILEAVRLVPLSHIYWLKSLPMMIETKDLILTHAPIRAGLSLGEALSVPMDYDSSLIWNREIPSPRDKFQAFGHNSEWGLTWIKDYAVCLDSSQQGLLTGMHWPTKKIYQVRWAK